MEKSDFDLIEYSVVNVLVPGRGVMQTPRPGAFDFCYQDTSLGVGGLSPNG